MKMKEQTNKTAIEKNNFTQVLSNLDRCADEYQKYLGRLINITRFISHPTECNFDPDAAINVHDTFVNARNIFVSFLALSYERAIGVRCNYEYFLDARRIDEVLTITSREDLKAFLHYWIIGFVKPMNRKFNAIRLLSIGKFFRKSKHSDIWDLLCNVYEQVCDLSIKIFSEIYSCDIVLENTRAYEIKQKRHDKKKKPKERR